MCTNFSELAHRLAVMHAHITVESGAGKRLALDLSNAALQVSINAKELDAEARTIRQIADDLPD